MMNLRSFKNRFKRLQFGRFRWIVAAVASIQQTILHRSACKIFIDADGDWVNMRRGFILVSPELNVSSVDEVLAQVSDLWCYGYTPKPSDFIIDVGAGIGDDVIAFSRLVGSTGIVLAIEAHPDAYRCLVKTIARNKIDNVVALNIALMDHDGIVSISSNENYLSNSVFCDDSNIKVEASRLDDILSSRELGLPDLIKMNIEGAEVLALNGMKRILGRVPNIVISCHDFKADRCNDPSLRTYDEVKARLLAEGYFLANRPEDARSEVRFYLYASIPSI